MAATVSVRDVTLTTLRNVHVRRSESFFFFFVFIVALATRVIDILMHSFQVIKVPERCAALFTICFAFIK
jgi:hypothetical protein